MGKGNFNKNQFKCVFSRNDKFLCYGCNQPGHLKNECPSHNETKKDKMKKKILVETWSDSDPSSSNDESIIEERANFCLMEKEDMVCNDDYDTLQHEYDCLLILKNSWKNANISKKLLLLSIFNLKMLKMNMR